MGKRGPMPQKSFLKAMSGNLPMTQGNMDTQQRYVTPPPRPKHLSREEKAIWKKTIELLSSLQVLQVIDGPVLGAFCCSYARWVAAEKEIQIVQKKNTLGALIVGAKNSYSVNPLITVSRRAQADMVTYAAQLGMTPAARSRLAADSSSIGKRKVNAFAKLKKIKDERVDKKGTTVRKSSNHKKKQT